MQYNFHISQQTPLIANDITDPWDATTDIGPKAPPEFIRKIEAKIRHNSEHLMTAATLDVPRIAAPKTPEALSPDLLLLQDEIKIHGFAHTSLSQTIGQALALIWWSQSQTPLREF
jgi:hypothetical protein